MSIRQIISRILDENCDRPHPEQALMILAAISDVGYVIVPKEPTMKMCEAGNVALENATDTDCDSDWDSAGDGHDGSNTYTIIRSTAPHEIFTAMIAASK